MQNAMPWMQSGSLERVTGSRLHFLFLHFKLSKICSFPLEQNLLPVILSASCQPVEVWLGFFFFNKLDGRKTVLQTSANLQRFLHWFLFPSVIKSVLEELPKCRVPPHEVVREPGLILCGISTIRKKNKYIKHNLQLRYWLLVQQM